MQSTLYHGEGAPDGSRARRELEEIRRVVARTTRFSHVSGAAWVASGALAMGAAPVCHWFLEARRPPGGGLLAPPGLFAEVWGTVFTVSVCLHMAGMWRRGREGHDPTFRRLLPQVLAAFGPSAAVGAALTLWCLLHSPAHDELVVPAWQMAYGLGLLAASMITIWEVRLAGLAFVGLGLVALFALPGAPMSVMAAGFGGIHVAVGLRIAWRQRP
ncbi:MAG: hypothetical protein HY722_17410 [Planctomycetes bacterium]|nr:hypothetical protein [Planctomycetota bacterium]